MSRKIYPVVFSALFALLVAVPLPAVSRKKTGEIRMSTNIKKPVKLGILGIMDYLPYDLVAKMAPRFVEYAKNTHGYEVSFAFEATSIDRGFVEMFSRSHESRTPQYNLIFIDSQHLGLLAESEWIVQLNPLIEREPALDIEWCDPVLTKYHQEYPEGSGRLWGLPCEGDVIVLFVRKDLFGDPDEQKVFKKRYGFALPRNFEDWEKIRMTDFEKIAEFFTRPSEGLWGTAMQYSGGHDFISSGVYPFMFSLGGEIWDAGKRQIWGVLNSEVNAEAMAWNRRVLKYQPPGAMSLQAYSISTLFTMGNTATALEWASFGASMVREPMKGKVEVAPPPTFTRMDGSVRRVYPIGGQPWAIDSSNDPDHMRATVDFLKWWYLPATQLEFARGGGNPADRATVTEPGFDGIQPWFRAYRYMLTAERTRDFWHDPKYLEMLDVQQEGFHAYASGKTDDAKGVLDWIACRQQRILYDGGRSTVRPPEDCESLAPSRH